MCRQNNRITLLAELVAGIVHPSWHTREILVYTAADCTLPLVLRVAIFTPPSVCAALERAKQNGQHKREEKKK